MSAPDPGPEYQQRPFQQQPAPAAWGGPVPLRPDEERTWAVLGHALPLVGLGFLAPLVIWQCFANRGAYLEEQAKESLNFQLTLLIAVVVGIATAIFGIGIVILIAASIIELVFCIMAALAASRYEHYRYPLSIRFVH